jgi:translation initiation factor 1
VLQTAEVNTFSSKKMVWKRKLQYYGFWTQLKDTFSQQLDKLFPGEKSAPQQRSLGRVVLRRETAHRGGKTVIVIHDFASFISTNSIDELARKLRRLCGCGGTTRERTIEIQGDHAGKIRAILEQEGFRVAGVK